MADFRDLPTVTSVEQLESYGVPAPAARDKVRDSLHPLDVEWLAASPLVFIGTSDADGGLDVSPKGDPAGFVKALDERTIVIPERPGNNRMDGFHNLLSNPSIGLLFVIPGRGDTLRINGTARIVTDGPFFDDLVVKGHRPPLALLVDIDEIFYHCPKAFMRSAAWQPEKWNPDAVLSFAGLAKAMWRAADPPEEVDERYSEKRYATILYTTDS